MDVALQIHHGLPTVRLAGNERMPPQPSSPGDCCLQSNLAMKNLSWPVPPYRA